MNALKETVKQYFSNKTKEELLDMVADLFITAMNTNVMQGMADANMQYVNEQQQKALMDAINGDCSKIIQYCRKLKSNRTFNGLKKIKCNQEACDYYFEEDERYSEEND